MRTLDEIVGQQRLLGPNAPLRRAIEAGNIYSMGNYKNTPGVNTEDVLPIKKEEPRILVYQGDYISPGPRRSFGWQPFNGKSPFTDERVRQAVSMSWDRALFTDAFYDAKKFADAGLAVQARWNTGLIGTQEGL